MVQALDSLLPLARTSVLKKSLAKLKDSVVEGKSFAQALGLFPSTFTNLYRNMVKAGESSGTLEIVLERLADILEKQQQLKNKITSALAYPILLALFGAAVLFFSDGPHRPQYYVYFRRHGPGPAHPYPDSHRVVRIHYNLTRG